MGKPKRNKKKILKPRIRLVLPRNKRKESKKNYKRNKKISYEDYRD